MSISSVGAVLKKMWLCQDASLAEIGSGLNLVRPFSGRFDTSWMVELTNMSLNISHDNAPERTIRGQIFPFQDRWFLVATPDVSTPSQLREFGLELNDLPFQNVAGDLLIANEANTISLRESQAHAVRLQQALNQLHSVNKILAEFIPPEITQTLDLPDREQDDVAFQAEAVGRFIAQLQGTLDFRQSFLANMSHELRTPLNAVLGLTEIMAEGLYGEVTDKQREMLLKIHGSGQDLLSLINDILDLNKIITGQVELDKASMSIVAVCESVFATQKHQAEQKGINLALHAEEGLPEITADEKKLRNALQNLVENAIKFSDEGEVTIRVFLKSDGERIAVEIADTGVGISQEQQEDIFQPFVQLDRGYNRKHEGTGLGLAIAMRTVELHHGSIELTSTLGKGSVFTVVLPVRNEARRASSISKLTPIPLPAKNEDSAGHLNNHVLLVDDTEINRRYVKDYLSSQGLRVSECSSALEALSFIAESVPNLILVDIHMPTMSGLDLIRCLRAMPQTREVPIVVFSASMSQEDQHLCLEVGANEFLQKPCSLAVLSDRIHYYLRKPS